MPFCMQGTPSGWPLHMPSGCEAHLLLLHFYSAEQLHSSSGSRLRGKAPAADTHAQGHACCKRLQSHWLLPGLWCVALKLLLAMLELGQAIIDALLPLTTAYCTSSQCLHRLCCFHVLPLIQYPACTSGILERKGVAFMHTGSPGDCCPDGWTCQYNITGASCEQATSTNCT